MHAYLIVGNNASEKLDEILDQSYLKLNYSLGTIEQIRDFVSFTQLAAAQNTAILINDLEKATLESQNTLLKAIEEPQNNLKFVIFASSEEAIIETIRSRCLIIYSQTSSEESDNSLENFFELSVGEKFNITSKIKKREEAIEFLENLIKSGHKNVDTNSKALSMALKTLKAIRANGNVNLQLTNFIVSIQAN